MDCGGSRRIENPMATTLQVSAEARPECIRPLRNLVERFASDAGFSDSDAYAVKVCVNEAVANAVVHAYATSESGVVNVSLRDDEDQLEVAVADEGQTLYEIRDGDDELHLGLTLITRLATHCTFTAAPDGTEVEMVFTHPRHEGRGEANRSRFTRDLDVVFRRAA
jgi:anti-sigma regulatory factor (Ser/Thr protein kinase)